MITRCQSMAISLSLTFSNTVHVLSLALSLSALLSALLILFSPPEKEGWTIFNIANGEDQRNMSAYATSTAAVLYSSHVLEHSSHNDAVRTLQEYHRVLAPGGELRLSVPDLDTLARLFLDKTLPVSARQHVVRMM